MWYYGLDTGDQNNKQEKEEKKGGICIFATFESIQMQQGLIVNQLVDYFSYIILIIRKFLLPFTLTIIIHLAYKARAK